MVDLIKRLREFRDARDWDQFHTPKDLAISVSVEASELLELFQWRPENVPCDPELTEKAKGELADVYLYLILLADKLGIDLQQAALEKIDLNETRFPVSSSFGVAKPQK